MFDLKKIEAGTSDILLAQLFLNHLIDFNETSLKDNIYTCAVM